MKFTLASLAVLVSFSIPIAFAQAPAAIQPASTEAVKKAPEKPITFDVVSVKPNKSGSTDQSWGMNPDGLTGRNVHLHTMLLMAYQLHDDELINEPKWSDTDGWDIDARISAEDMAAMGTLTYAQRLSMMQAILSDRFGLKTHRETRELPVYTLTVAKGGQKMTPSKIDPSQPMMEGMPGVLNYRRAKSAIITASMASMSGLAEELSDGVGRKVVDGTGLTGRYDFTLKWTPDEDMNGGTAPDSSAPSLFTAVEEQLGLRLVSAKSPVAVLVIDAIERPSQN